MEAKEQEWLDDQFCIFAMTWCGRVKWKKTRGTHCTRALHSTERLTRKKHARIRNTTMNE